LQPNRLPQVDRHSTNLQQLGFDDDNIVQTTRLMVTHLRFADDKHPADGGFERLLM